MLSPWSLWGAVKLGREEGVWNRPTESGNRWQGVGWWGVDGRGNIAWGAKAQAADEIGCWEEGVRALEGTVGK